ncbi:hypothetical protein BSZ07_12605 [Streptomyces sp. M1013]|nr:hypothetical protein BSZ07_12605 [Streptomyces sp. M1013]
MRDPAAVLRLRLPREAEGRLDDALDPDWLLARVGDAVFFAAVFFAVEAFFAAEVLLAVDLPAVDLAAVDLLAVDLAAVFLAPVVRFAAAVFVPAALAVPVFAVSVVAVPVFSVPALAVVFRACVRSDFVSAPPPWPALPFRSCPRDCVSQATAAPVAATGHSTSPATPSTPAPV